MYSAKALRVSHLLLVEKCILLGQRRNSLADKTFRRDRFSGKLSLTDTLLRKTEVLCKSQPQDGRERCERERCRDVTPLERRNQGQQEATVSGWRVAQPHRHKDQKRPLTVPWWLSKTGTHHHRVPSTSG